MAADSIPSTALNIIQGKTFSRVVRWMGLPYIYIPIASITKTAPARITTQGVHGLVDGWPVAVVSAQGMKEINADVDTGKAPRSRDYRQATYISTTAVDLNAVNAALFTAHTANSGYLQFYTPRSLAGATVRMTVRDKPGGTALLTLSSPSSGITLDDTAKIISMVVSATATAAMTWQRGVYEVEIQAADGRVFPLLRGPITVSPKEIAT